MSATETEKLPKGWKGEEWQKRQTQLKALPKRVRVLLAAEWARSVLPVFEAKRSNDDRPRKAIEAAEAWARDPSEKNRKAAAADAADAADAAADAAAAAAAYAAYAAADAADAADAYAAAYAAADAAAYAAADAAAAAAADAAAAAAADAAAAAADAAAAAYAAYAAADAAAYAAADAAAYAADARKKKWCWLYRTYKHARGPGLAFDPAWRTDTSVLLARQIFDSRDFSTMPILADALQDGGLPEGEVLNHLRTTANDEFTRADWVLCSLLGYDSDE